MEAEFEPLLASASELETFSKAREAEIQKEISTIDAEIVRSLLCMQARGMQDKCSW